MFGSLEPAEKLKDAVRCEVDTLVSLKIVPSRSGQKSQETTLKSTTTTVRVDIEKLDRILNTIGELTLAKGAVKG